MKYTYFVVLGRELRRVGPSAVKDSVICGLGGFPNLIARMRTLPLRYPELTSESIIVVTNFPLVPDLSTI
jgi:hypothetical protein